MHYGIVEVLDCQKYNQPITCLRQYLGTQISIKANSIVRWNNLASSVEQIGSKQS